MPGVSSDRFSKFIRKNFNSNLPLLPLIHTTTGYRFAEILPGDELHPVYCQNFDEEMIYLFYGRPAYKSKDSVNTHLYFNWPIVFVFDSEKISNIIRIYPFDTGAFKNGIYKEFFHQDSCLEDFELDGDIKNAATLVDIFYSKLYTYYNGRTDKNVDLDLMDFEAQGILELARVPSQFRDGDEIRRDERSSTIEVQIGEKLQLSQNLLAIILPQSLSDHESVVEALDRWKPKELSFYDPVNNLSSESISGEIYGIIRGIYEKYGVLDRSVTTNRSS